MDLGHRFESRSRRAPSPASSIRSNDPLNESEDTSENATRTIPLHQSISTPSPSQKPSVEVDEKPPSPKNRSIWDIYSEWCVAEISAVVLSAGTLIALVVLLAKFDQRPQPDWKYVSLNSAVSWLATISKGCILFAMNEALGQLKWVWFAQKTRPLLDLRTFDSASRGFYGSAELIWTLRFQHFAVFGSLGVILALAFDPFAQNLIHYYPNMVENPSQQALLANSFYFDAIGADSGDRGLLTRVDSSLKGNIYNALFSNDPSRPWAEPQNVCSTSNCTWDPAPALETRALCSKVSNKLKMSCSVLSGNQTYHGNLNCTVSLPSNTSAWFVKDLAYGTILSVAAVGQAKALVYTNASFPPVQIIAQDGLGLRSNASWEAVECSIEPIVRAFRATVRDNVYREETLAVWADSWTTWDRRLNTSKGDIVPGRYLEPKWDAGLGLPANQKFYIGVAAAASIGDFFQILFTGAVTLVPFPWGIRLLPGNSRNYAAADFLEAMVSGNITGCTVQSADKLRCAMQNVAAAMTKSFRDSPYIKAGLDLHNIESTTGRALSSVTYTKVHWQWILLPLLVWVLGAATLVGTMWKSRRGTVPKWRNDPIPLLFLYREGNQEGSGVSEGEASERAENLKVRLYDSSSKAYLGTE